MKKCGLFLLLIVTLLSCNKRAAEHKIAMVIPASVEAFKQIENGINEVCDSTYSLRVFSAESKSTAFNTTVDAALITKPDFFVAIGSQITTTVLSDKYKNKLPPVIAGAISVPSSVEALENIGINPPRKIQLNIVSHVPQISYNKLVEIIFDLKPSVQKIGIIYNESELNSKNMKIALSEVIERKDAIALAGAVTTVEDVYNITNKLIREGAEAIIIPHDKAATSKAKTIAELCDQNQILSCSLDDGILEHGVGFAVSVQYREVGRKIGLLIKDVVENNKNLRNMPMVSFEDEDVHIYINKTAFDKMGYKLSENIRGGITEITTKTE